MDDIVVVFGVGLGLFAFHLARLCRIELKMLLQAGLEVLQFRVPHPAGVGEVNVGGGDLRDRHIGVNDAVHVERRQLFIGADRQGCDEQAGYEKDSEPHDMPMLRSRVFVKIPA